MTLYVGYGSTDVDLATYVKRRLQTEPLLSWVEPRPGLGSGGALGPWKGLQILRQGRPQLDVPLDEVRLFWERHGLYVVADHASACQWLAYSEAPRPGLTLVSGEVRRADPYKVMVHRQQDWERFSVPGEPAAIQLEMVEYWVNNALLTWHLRLASDAVSPDRM